MQMQKEEKEMITRKIKEPKNERKIEKNNKEKKRISGSGRGGKVIFQSLENNSRTEAIFCVSCMC